MDSDHYPSWTPPHPHYADAPVCCMCNRLVTDMKAARVLVRVNGTHTPDEMRFVCGQQCLIHARKS